MLLPVGVLGMDDGALRFELLGPIRAFRGAEPVDLGPPKQQAVLALLLLHAPRPVPLEKIVATLWNGDPPSNGIDVVQRYIGALRRGLDPERTSLIALTDSGYVIRAGENTVDTGIFRAAVARAHTEHQTGAIGAATDEIRTALSLWQDEPLTGLSGPVFESARARLNSERAAASALLAEPTALAPSPPAPASPSPLPPGQPATRPFAGPAPSPSLPPPPAARPFPDPARTPSLPATTPFPGHTPSPSPSAPPATRPFAGPGPSLPATRPFSGSAPSPSLPATPATRPFPVPTSPAAPEPEKPVYPEAVDPWDGHDLFPPDPLSMN
jgi:DNA-binding winged helix-turn-helix (wHTH) protein